MGPFNEKMLSRKSPGNVLESRNSEKRDENLASVAADIFKIKMPSPCGDLSVCLRSISFCLILQESLLSEGNSGDKTFYGSDEDEDEDEEEKGKKAEAMAKRKPYVMDPDHRLLLRNTKPLLQSRNAAVRLQSTIQATSLLFNLIHSPLI